MQAFRLQAPETIIVPCSARPGPQRADRDVAARGPGQWEGQGPDGQARVVARVVLCCCTTESSGAAGFFSEDAARPGRLALGPRGPAPGVPFGEAGRRPRPETQGPAALRSDAKRGTEVGWTVMRDRARLATRNGRIKAAPPHPVVPICRSDPAPNLLLVLQGPTGSRAARRLTQAVPSHRGQADMAARPCLRARSGLQPRRFAADAGAAVCAAPCPTQVSPAPSVRIATGLHPGRRTDRGALPCPCAGRHPARTGAGSTAPAAAGLRGWAGPWVAEPLPQRPALCVIGHSPRSGAISARWPSHLRPARARSGGPRPERGAEPGTPVCTGAPAQGRRGTRPAVAPPEPRSTQAAEPQTVAGRHRSGARVSPRGPGGLARGPWRPLAEPDRSPSPVREARRLRTQGVRTGGVETWHW